MKNDNFLNQEEIKKFTKSKIDKEFSNAIVEIEKIDTFNKLEHLIEKTDRFIDQFYNMYTKCYIKHDANTKDKLAQNNYKKMDAYYHFFKQKFTEFKNALCETKFKNKLIEKYGYAFVKSVEYDLKINQPSVENLSNQETKLVMQYHKLKAELMFDFDGEKVNLMNTNKYLNNIDREKRHRYNITYYETVSTIEKEATEIMLKLIKVRNEKSEKLQLKSVQEYSLYKLKRIKYSNKEVENFKNYTRKYISPLLAIFEEKQKQNLGLDALYYYDTEIYFNDGNPQINISYKETLDTTKQMYQNMSAETKQFINKFFKHKCYDLEPRNNKMPGGYCTFITSLKMPFVFTSLNGNFFDYLVLTHELGHGFQFYNAYNKLPTNLLSINPDYAEIFSQAMEFICYEYVPQFFKQDAEKFYFLHFFNSLKSIESCCIGDDFQTKLYSLSNVNDINKAYNDSILKYKNLAKNDDCNFVKEGKRWMLMGHFYGNPFYFIDYALAMIHALNIWKIYDEDKTKGWNLYLQMCQNPQFSFAEISEHFNLPSPFSEQTFIDLKQFLENKMKALLS